MTTMVVAERITLQWRNNARTSRPSASIVSGRHSSAGTAAYHVANKRSFRSATIFRSAAFVGCDSPAKGGTQIAAMVTFNNLANRTASFFVLRKRHWVQLNNTVSQENMTQNTVAFYIGQIIGAAIGVPIGAFLGALVLRWATKWLAKVNLRYWGAYKIVVIVGFAGYLVGLLIGYIWTHSGGDPAGAMLVGLVAGIPLSGWLYGSLIKKEDGAPIGFGLGVKLSAVLTALVVGVLMIIGGAVLLASREPSSEVSAYSAPPPKVLAVEATSLVSVEVFDGSIPWNSDGRGTMYSNEIKGRIRNSLAKPISRVRIYVVLKGPAEETIETMRFDVGSVSVYAPLMPGDARSWTHKGWWERLPKDMKWSWTVIEADYASP